MYSARLSLERAFDTHVSTDGHMAHQTLYPMSVGLVDLGFAGLLLTIAPVLGVMTGVIGFLVIGTCLIRFLVLFHTGSTPGVAQEF